MTRPADSAIFAGTCTLCDGPIKRGHRVVPKGHHGTWVHRSCWEAEHE